MDLNYIMLIRWFAVFSLSPLLLTKCLLQLKQPLTHSKSKTGVHVSLRGLFSLQRNLTVPPLTPMHVRHNSLPSGDFHYVTYYCAASVRLF